MALRGRVERIVEKLNGGAAPQNEETAKVQVILPILRELGWDVNDDRGLGEVAYEYPVGGRRGGGKADIVLLDPPSRAVCLVEAKAPSEELDKHVEQLLNYAFQDTASICALTNGLIWWLYLPRGRGAPRDRRFAELNLQTDDLAALCRDFKQFLSRDALFTDDAERAANEAIKHRQEVAQIKTKLPALWERMTESDPDKALVGLVQKRLMDEEHLQASAKQVAAVIGGRKVPVGPQADRPGQNTVPPGNQRPAEEQTNVARAKNPKPIAVEIFGVRRETRWWRDVLVEVVTVLHHRHPDFFATAEEVITAGYGKVRKVPLFTRDRSILSAPFEVGNTGVYMDSHKSAAVIQKYVERLLEGFGYQKSDYKVEFAD